jgi:hypothetical protein
MPTGAGVHSAAGYGMFGAMQFAPVFLMISGFFVAYAVEHPAHVVYAVLVLIGWRILSR